LLRHTSIISPLASIFDHLTAAARASTALASIFDHLTAAARASTALASHSGHRLGSHYFDHFTARLVGGTDSAPTATLLGRQRRSTYRE
jgi:hypothetical protein